MQSFYFDLLTKFSYVGLFLVLIAAGLGIPLPEDIPLVASGWLVHQGGANLYGMIAMGLLGVMVGDSLLFSMGRRYGTHIVDHPWLRRFAKPWLLEKARSLYGRYGMVIIFAARFMPGLRSVLFLTAGVFRVPYWKFFLIDGFAALISVPAWIVAGWKFSEQIEKILGGARIATYVIVGVLLTGLIIWVIYEYRHNLRNREAISAEEAARNLSGLIMPQEDTVKHSSSSHQDLITDSGAPSPTSPAELSNDAIIPQGSNAARECSSSCSQPTAPPSNGAAAYDAPPTLIAGSLTQQK